MKEGILIRNYEQPVIHKYVQKISSNGEVLETIIIDKVSTDKKNEIMKEVFMQGIGRLGYEPIRS